MVGASVGSSVTLECLVESFPKASIAWERYDGVPIRQDNSRGNSKYLLSEWSASEHFSRRAILNMTLTNSNDFGIHFCRADNGMGTAKAGISVYGTGFFL